MRYGLTADERWNRVAIVMFVMGAIFLAAAIYGLWNGGDFRGSMMTLAPAALMLALGWFAIRQRNRIIYGTPLTALDWVVRVASAALVVAFCIVIRFRIVEPSQLGERDETQVIELPTDLEEVDVPTADGHTIKTLARKHRQHREDCPDRWVEASYLTSMVGHCADPLPEVHAPK